MFIEKTTLIEFDEVAERERIMGVFKGARQKRLLEALDLMIAGDFVALARAVVHMPQGEIEFMAIPVQDVANGVILQKMAEMAYADGNQGVIPPTVLECPHMRGLLRGVEGTRYPRFLRRDLAPAPAEYVG